jgi:hypothetical protein
MQRVVDGGVTTAIARNEVTTFGVGWRPVSHVASAGGRMIDGGGRVDGVDIVASASA